jgi:hypothetical protein
VKLLSIEKNGADAMYSRNSGYKQEKTQGNKFNVKRLVYVFLPVLLLTVLMSACAGQAAQPASTQPNPPPAAPAVPNKTPVVPVSPTVVVPVTPPVAPVPPAPVQVTTPPAQTLPPAQGGSTYTASADELIRTQACDMTLTLDDIGQGWLKGNAVPASKTETLSSCGVHYYKGTSFSPVVQNNVAVYRSLDAAGRAYAKEENSQTASVTHPALGNECFLNTSVAINQVIVFRKGNVVVWVWLQQDRSGDVERYARIVEQRITQ